MSQFDDDEALDLSALGAGADQVQADRVIGAAMARIHATDRATSSPAMLADVARWWYPGLAAAAVILAMATGVTLFGPSRPADPVELAGIEGQVLDWARTGHVPTNADLLAAFGANR